PNCSTIEMVLALKAIDDAAGLETVRVSTYQSCSGAGQKGIDALLDETHQALAGRRPVYSQVHARGIAFDVVPQIGAILTHGFTEEEMKMIGETKKILSRPDLRISATCVRVPVLRGHCEVVHVTTRQALPPKEAEQALNAMPGLRVTDIQDPLDYPTATQSEGIFETLIGRVREDYAADKGLIFWIVSDNLLKGAALNAVQVACIAWNQGRMDSNAN
ncbi:MAG: aspartate-semialdehyde dehydrogenase, partial [Proteobacteria bacterium]|nr:aspartate-semialdehyde dehydrogenase [Pseudomonadota bacterium]